MSEFTVRHNCPYCELIIIDNNTQLSTGLLDDDERLELAYSMLSSVEDLLPTTHMDMAENLNELRHKYLETSHD